MRYDPDYPGQNPNRVPGIGSAPPPYVSPAVTDPAHFDPAYSPEQWKAWESQKKAGCPPETPYAGREGQCASKPDDCPEGKQVVGNDAAGTAKCVSPNEIRQQTTSTQTPPTQTSVQTSTPTQTYVPPQYHDPLGGMGTGIQNVNDRTIQSSATPPPAVAAQDQQRRRLTGMGGSTPIIGLGIH